MNSPAASVSQVPEIPNPLARADALEAAMDAQESDAESEDVTAETLSDDGTDGRCELDDGQHIAQDTVRRIACDGSLLHITEDIAGNPLRIGRKSCC